MKSKSGMPASEKGPPCILSARNPSLEAAARIRFTIDASLTLATRGRG
jgi:hypothetical protein